MWKGGFRKRRAVGSNPIAWLPLVFDTNSYVRNGHERDRVISFCLSSLRLWRLVPRGADFVRREVVSHLTLLGYAAPPPFFRNSYQYVGGSIL